MGPVDQRTVIAVDPGRCKCGIAVVKGGPKVEILHRSVASTGNIVDILTELCVSHRPDVILLGNGTTAKELAKVVGNLGVRLELVDERLTSVAARKRYFLENPPHGLRRLIPSSMQTPGEAYDDYVAVILAERYLRSEQSSL